MPVFKIILIISGLLYSLSAQQSEFYPIQQVDENVVSIQRVLPDSALNVYQADKDFQKMFSERTQVSVWGMIWAWFWYNILRFIFTPALMPFWHALFYIVIAGIFIYFISRVLKSSPRGLFFKSRKAAQTGNPAVFSTEDINSDASDKLKQAIENKDFREALRILFVRTLQLLQKNRLIIFQKGKTNLEYLREISKPDFQSGFRNLALIFDYVWYGEFAISEERFKRFQQYFNDYHKLLGR
ncbi:MAG: DUF4129 domain-containing protein [Calditrichaceae bacterium]|nr:DUF4129 domain-containing protein [Calditrichaceae bacterium]MBN2708694.1 DUF4129 domain-containing protein [Calditrichaceae bacterium]